MAAPTPIGAISITIPVNLNIVSARLSANASIGRRFSIREQRERHAEEHAEDDDLQHLGFSDRAGDVLGEDVEHDVLPALLSPAAESASSRRRPAA